MKIHPAFVLGISFILLFGFNKTEAEVIQSNADGFKISLQQSTSLSAPKTYAALVDDFSEWWDASHSYSGKAENLSLNLERHCMFEQLPHGGFVRHMEIVYHQPGQALRMTGGLGPLQEMGVTGCLAFILTSENEQTKISLTYQVTGFSGQELDKLAPVVDQVLADQLARLQKYCERTTAGK